MDLYTELSSEGNVLPMKFNKMYVYADSMVCLAWLKSYGVTHDKMQKRSIIVQNKLKPLLICVKKDP